MLRELLPDSVVVVETTEASAPADLHPEEAACVERAAPKRRREFASGRMCARRALAELGVHDFPLLPDANRVPVWPPGVVGSITHSSGFYAAAVARSSGVLALGVDVEDAQPLDADLVPRVCTAVERERLSRLPALPGLDWPKLHFSAKEAAYKSYYPLARHMLAFHDMELEIDPEARRFTARLLTAGAPDAAGRRIFRGRFGVDASHVCTGVVLE